MRECRNGNLSRISTRSATTLRYLSALFVGIITIEAVRQIRHARANCCANDHTSTVRRSQTSVHECSLAEQSARLCGVLVISLEEAVALEYPVPRLASLHLVAVRMMEDSQRGECFP